MTYIGAFANLAAPTGRSEDPANDHTTSSIVTMQAGDVLLAVLFVAAIGSPSSSIAATVDDLVAPPGWLRLDADTIVESGDPSVLTGVAAVYAYRAPTTASQQFTWSWRLPSNGRSYGRGNGRYAMIYGLQYRGPVGVGGFAVDRTFRRTPTTSVTYPAPAAKAGSGHVVRAAVLGLEVASPDQIAAPAGHTKLTGTSGLDAGAVYVFTADHMSVLLAAADVTGAVPGAAQSTWNASGTIGAGVVPAIGWTVFLSDVLAPLPPTLISPANGSWLDLAAGFRVELQHNTLGTVGDLSGISLWRSTDGGTTRSWWKASTGTWEATEQVNTTTNPWLDFPAAKWTNAATDYTIGIATTGTGSTVLSEYTTFHLVGSAAPTAFLSVTGLAGGLVNDVTPTAVVVGSPATAATLTGWRVRIFDLLTTGRNLAPNASFEAGITGWVGKGFGYTPGVCAWSTLFPTHGDHTLRVQWPGGGVGAVGADFAVEVGKAYTWFADVRVPSGSPDVRAAWLYHGSGALTAVKDATVRVQHTFVADATTVTLGFEAVGGQPGLVYVDRIGLVEGFDAGEWVYSDPDAGTPTIDSGLLLGEPGSYTVPRELALTPHNPYRVYAQVRQSGGQWSPWVHADVEPDVDTPAAPTVTVARTTHPVSGAPGLSVAAVMPAWTGGQLRARVQRSLGGAWTDIGTDLLTPAGVTHLDDWTAPSMLPAGYRVRAETTDLDGAPLVGDWSTMAVGVLDNTAHWLIDPNRPETAVRAIVTGFDSKAVDSQAQAVVPLAAAGVPVAPIVVSSAPVLPSGQATVRADDVTHHQQIMALLTSGATLMLRWWKVRTFTGGEEPGRDLLFRVIGTIGSDLLYQGPTSAEHVTFSWVGQYPTSGADTETSWTVVDAGVRS